MLIDTILFDLDGTLLDRRKTFQLHLEQQLNRLAWCFTGMSANRYITELLALDEAMVDRDTFYVEAERRCNLPPGTAEVLKADFDAHFPEFCVPFPNVRRTLETLWAARFKLGVVTNGRTLIQSRKINRLAIRPLLGSVVISEAAGYSKPDPRIFAHALGELKSTAAASVFVGDNPDVDVVGAKASGLIAVWKRDAYWSEPSDADLIIDEIAELPNQLATLTERSSA